MKQLDWYRNSSYQSKDIAHVQKTITQRIADKVLQTHSILPLSSLMQGCLATACAVAISSHTCKPADAGNMVGISISDQHLLHYVNMSPSAM